MKTSVPILFRAWALLAALATPASAQLSLTRTADEIVVTSSAGPTWKIVIATCAEASMERPGGGTVRALHIPAGDPESLLETDPARFRRARWGLDSLEWRYIDDGKGVRSALGTTATIDSLEIAKQTPQQIVILITGRWQNVPRFTRRIEIDPHGFHTRLEAEWAGPTDKRGMWWMHSVFRSTRVDQHAITVEDADSPATRLPTAQDNVFPLPQGIAFPYETTFPLKRGPVSALRLRVASFGDDQPAGLNYELWPEKHGVFIFFPRWVNRRFERRRYIFDYTWTIVPAESSRPPRP